MAQKMQVILTDDVDGGPADETIQFAVDGVTYEIDLSSAHVGAFRESFGEWIDAARKVGGGRSGRSGRPPRTVTVAVTAGRAPSDADKVRVWARAHGFEVKGRGRVSGDVRAAYAAANA